MADYRALLAQFPTARAATAAKRAFSDAFAAHIAAVKKRERYSHELTEPLLAFARSEGFEWDEEDAFTWDDDDDDPALHVGTAGKVLVIYHAAASQLADVGLQAFARRRGATVTMFWNPDPFGTVHVKVANPAGFAKAFDALAGEHDTELELSDDDPGTEEARLVVSLGTKTRYVALRSRWGVGGLLLDLGARPGVQLALELPPPPVERPGAVRDIAVAGPISDIIHAIRRARLGQLTVEECIAEGVRLGGDDSRSLFQLTIDNRVVEPLTNDQLRAIAAEPVLARKLALACPISQRDAAMAATAHANWLKTKAKPPHTWRSVEFLAGLHLVLYTGKVRWHGVFGRCDLRRLTLAERPLAAAGFAGALLEGTNFTKTDLSYANFAQVFAKGASFTGATLTCADFTGADLRGASFRDADLRDAIWTDAIVDGADFTGARR